MDGLHAMRALRGPIDAVAKIKGLRVTFWHTWKLRTDLNICAFPGSESLFYN